MNRDYEIGLSHIRQMPQETSVQKETKRREAKLFRMQTQMDNARMANECLNTLSKTPDIPAEDLKKSLFTKEGLVDEKNINSYVDALVDARDRTITGLQSIGSQVRESGGSVERYLFQLLQRSTVKEEPEGRIKLDLSCPLAIGLQIFSETDYRKINVGNNVGGFYQQIHHYEAPNIPIFIVGYHNSPIENTAISIHEIGHAKNEAFRTALLSLNRPFIRLAYNVDLLDREGKHKVIEILDNRFQTNLEDAINSDEWKLVIESSYNWAANELLANINSQNGIIVGTLWQQFHNLVDPNNLYNFFVEDWKMDSHSSLYRSLWQDYSKTLETAVRSASSIFGAYQSIGLNKRLEIFPGILAQIPLWNWHKQLEETLYLEEAKSLVQIWDKHLNNITSNASSKEKKAEEKIYLEFRNQCSNSQEKPLISVIEEFKLKLPNLKD